MATVSPKLTIPFVVNTDKIVGQGNHPEIQTRLSLSAGTDMGPVWTDVPSKLRSYSVKRGRSAELEQVSPAALEAVIDNNDRAFDPTYASSPYSPNLRPGNRVWMRALFSGQTFDRFVGDVTSYTQRWPHGGHDAETSVQAADVLQRLSRMKLPVMDPLPDPPASPTGQAFAINRVYAQTYADVVRHDKPGAFWLMHDSALTESARADIGTSLKAENGLSSATNFPPIVGDNPDPQSYLILQPASGPMYLTAELPPGEAPDMGGLEEMTVEFWFKTDVFPVSDETLMRGPDVDAGATVSWAFNLRSAKTIRFIVTDQGGTANTADTGVLVANTWYHVVGTITGDTIRVYLNGVQQNTDSFAGSTIKATFGTPYVDIGFRAGSGTAQQWGFSHVAAWREGLSADRILAHYTAGTQRGYPRAQTTHERVIDVLDDTGLFAPRNIQTSTRVMRGAFSYGQPPIQELREAERLELADGLLFATRNGTITFLNSGHRSSSPYNTVQATFDMPSTTEPEYTDLVPDFSDDSLVNRWEGQAEGGLVQSAEDTASLALNGEYAQSVSGLQTYDDTIVLSIVTLLLAKTKDAQHRIISLNLNTGDPDTCEILLRLDIGDRIRVLWTPPAGGSQIDQTSFVQSINETGSRDDPRLFFQIGITPR